MAGSTRVTDYLEAAAQAAGFQQKVVANNIANLNTPGFRRQTLSFQAALGEAMREGKPVDMDQLSKAVVQTGKGPTNDRGNDVDLDVEIGELIKSGGRYKSCVRMLNRMYRQMEQAMTGLE